MTEPWIKDNLILSCVHGSHMRGLATEFSDVDHMGITVEPHRYVTGLNEFGQAEIKDRPTGARSEAGDEETVIYGLRKWAKLAAKGNPSVLEVLFAPEYEVKTDAGQLLIGYRSAFLSREAGRRFLGYSRGQRNALTGMKNKRTNRPELVHTHGFDTKFASHMIRTLFSGIDLMKTGEIKLPFEGEYLEALQQIRNGMWTKEATLDCAQVFEAALEEQITKSDLPDHADTDRVNRLLNIIYTETWKESA